MRNPDTDLRACSWQGMDPEKPAQPTRTLLHAHQAESFHASALPLKDEPLAVIAYRQADPFGRAAQLDGDLGRLGMFGHILQTLLHHAKQIGPNLLREHPWHLTNVKRH